jgi:periplasmic mercuric ion binding protein
VRRRTHAQIAFHGRSRVRPHRPSSAFAAEKTVTLGVKNMYCASCPHTVKASLLAVPGVTNVIVSMADLTAGVAFDDSKADVQALVKATTNAGYPSEPKS